MSKKGEPPSPCRPVNFFRIGKDSQDHWVVQDDQRLCGGLFVDRAAALKFAMFETGNRPQAVIMVPGTFELDLTGQRRAVAANEPHRQAAALRRAA